MAERKALGIREQRGYAMVALLVMMAVMAVAMTVALPAWSTMARREKEAELVFRGEQYARAIALFQRQYAGAFPPTIDVLVEGRFLRKKFKDPITNDDFKTIAVGEAVELAQTTDPLAPAGARGRAGGQAAGRGGAATGAPQTGGRSTFTLGGRTGQGAQTGGRATFTIGQGQGGVTIGQGGRGVDAGGVSAGIMGVTSKSEDESIREYKGADHYHQWLFIATQASVQAGGRGGRSPGEGVRGGQPPTPGRQGGPGGRGLPGSPFGTLPGRGQQPPSPQPGRGRF
jgi:type II secretory pathway pseudopilin PulG